jgi:indolepyruvate ferredoxin oxidoreductase
MDIGLGSLASVTLDSRYTERGAPVLLSGIQALVRLLLEQADLDRAAGLNTGGLVSGYRGSPLGGLDQELWRREALLAERNIRFRPGLNEDLAATMLWGAQQIEAFPGATVDGVFGMWYGKGPGVDRSADALRCANMIGTHRHGGVLAIAGDDHAAHSSTFPHQTDQIFQAVMIPVIQPADAAEIIELGLAGFAMSRFSGLWVALKTIAETAEQARTMVLPASRRFLTPTDIMVPPHGLNLDLGLQWPAERAMIERRVMDERLPAAIAWARANRLDRTLHDPAGAPVGLLTVGKAHHDVMHALARLGLRDDPRIAIRKVALSWPLETEGARGFAAGRRAVLVVEEKRSFVEAQLRDALYNLPADRRPAVAGKSDLSGATLIPAAGELSPELLAPALARFLRDAGIAVADPPEPARLARPEGLLTRAPTFCAGCPHNSSTRLPDGSFATAGIGCHIMALQNTPELPGPTRTFSHMGGEGAAWLGMAPFTTTPHMFVNMGDGTYQHSGILAIRQAVAAGANVTYKILFNDAVAMTGGQAAEGGPNVPQIARQVAAEGVARVVVLADDPARLPPPETLPPGTERHGRDALDAVQRRMRDEPGVTVLIYDQVCATEKRRRRKRGTMAAAEVTVSIDPRVCENCGDCTEQSHCIAIEPIETEFGRKRRVSPTACNTDLSCLKGFCPSFVTSRGPVPAQGERTPADPWAAREAALAATLPEPAVPHPESWRGLFAGIGGGGIVTTGAIVAMAAHLEGRQVSTLDFTGLAQKNGAVVSHVQIADAPIGTVRIPLGEAELMLAADLAVAAGAGVLERCRRDAAVIGSLDLQANLDFLHQPDLRIDAGLHRRTIERQVDAARSRFLRSAALSEKLFGTAQAQNTLLLGMAWQIGLLPIGQPALLRAIELNGTAVALNRRAFLWGRLLAADPALAAEVTGETRRPPPGLEALIAAREAELVAYQGSRLARRYRRLVDHAIARETAVAGAPGRLSRAVAEGWFRLLAYKDEYEVARLHSATEHGPDPVFHLAPPLLSRRDPATGRRRKIAIPGRIALPVFRLLRHGRVLRGTPLDPFGWQADRRLERRLIAQYARDLSQVLDGLSGAVLDMAADLAELPLSIRGYGPVKAAAALSAEPVRRALLQRIALPLQQQIAAE